MTSYKIEDGKIVIDVAAFKGQIGDFCSKNKTRKFSFLFQAFVSNSDLGVVDVYGTFFTQEEHEKITAVITEINKERAEKEVDGK